jgi:hypothetical protein
MYIPMISLPAELLIFWLVWHFGNRRAARRHGPYYKVISKDTAQFSYLSWPLPSDEEPGAWLKVKGLLRRSNALYLTNQPHIWWNSDREVYLSEWGGGVLYRSQEIRVRRARLVRKATDAELEALGCKS